MKAIINANIVMPDYIIRNGTIVIKDGKTGEMFKTEVQAFIKKFLSYDEAFGTLPDKDKPDIVIQMKESKKGNKYVNFDVMG